MKELGGIKLWVGIKFFFLKKLIPTNFRKLIPTGANSYRINSEILNSSL